MEYPQVIIINTTGQIRDLVNRIVHRHEREKNSLPTMYIDLEGVNLCREGTVSIFTLLLDMGKPIKCVYLIDSYSLGSQVFTTTGDSQNTLKDILEDEKIPKVFFDVRNDSDALFAHFGVALKGVHDVQLMESATRRNTRSRKYLNGLARCIERTLVGRERQSWRLAKDKGARLFKREHGGSAEIFNKRPIPSEIISYCVADVQYLPMLWDQFQRTRTDEWRHMVQEEAKKRVAETQRSDYKPSGPNKALAPWNEKQNKTLDRWNSIHFDNSGL